MCVALFFPLSLLLTPVVQSLRQSLLSTPFTLSLSSSCEPTHTASQVNSVNEMHAQERKVCKYTSYSSPTGDTTREQSRATFFFSLLLPLPFLPLSLCTLHVSSLSFLCLARVFTQLEIRKQFTQGFTRASVEIV